MSERNRRRFRYLPSPPMVIALTAWSLRLRAQRSQTTAGRTDRGVVNGLDVANGSLTGADIKNKSLTLADFRGRGPKGATGQEAQAGPAGPGGRAVRPARRGREGPQGQSESTATS